MIILMIAVTAAAVIAPDLLTRPAILVMVAVWTLLTCTVEISDAIEGRRIESGKRRLLRAVERVK